MATVHKWEKYTVASQFVDNGYENVVSCNYYSPPTVKLYSGTTPDSTTSTVLFDEIPDGSYFIFNSTTYRAASTAGRSGQYYNILAIPVAVAEGKGSLIETVESENSAAYPTDGAQDGYWYVYTGSEEIEVCAVYATIDGVQKKLTSIPAMIDGVQRELTSLFATVDGVMREIFRRAKVDGGESVQTVTVYSNDEAGYWSAVFTQKGSLTVGGVVITSEQQTVTVSGSSVEIIYTVISAMSTARKLYVNGVYVGTTGSSGTTLQTVIEVPESREITITTKNAG